MDTQGKSDFLINHLQNKKFGFYEKAKKAKSIRSHDIYVALARNITEDQNKISSGQHSDKWVSDSVNDILEAELNKIFLPIAQVSHSPEDFINRARIIKAVQPEISEFFSDRFGSGGSASMNEAAKNYFIYSKTI